MIKDRSALLTSTTGALLGLVLAAASLSALGLGCAKKCSGQSVEPRPVRASEAHRSTVSPIAKFAVATEDGARASTDASFASAMRHRNYQEVARLIDAATELERQKPEVRYARALAALELADPSRALEEVSDLAKAAPAFAERADHVALRVAKQTRDAVVLEHLLAHAARHGATDDRLLLAEALLESGQVKQGEAILTDILRALDRDKSPNLELMAKTRRVRADLWRQLGRDAEAAADYRWLALNAIGAEPALGADQHAERLAPSQRLTKAERLVRAQRLSERGAVESVEEEFRRLALAPGPAPAAQTQTFVRGWAVYASRSNYPLAAELFSRAAGESGPDRPKCLYYQAKSLARNAEHTRAIAVYKQAAGLGPSYVEPASYEAARLLHISGDWPAAIAAYEQYLRRFPKGAHKSSVEGDLPVVRLAVGAHDLARRELAALVRKTDDARERARLLELEGVAAAGQGDRKTAVALLGKVIEEQPLTLPALLAQNRLRALGAPIPPLLPPRRASSPSSPLPALELPDLVLRLHRVGLDDEAERALRSEEPALKARFGERAPEVLCRLYAELEGAMRRYQIAQTATKRETLFQEPTGDGRWQWECIYPRPYADFVREEATARSVPEGFVYGIMRQESAFRPSVVSSAQAVGLMQIIPATAARIGQELGTPYQPELMVAPPTNVRFGVYYLGKLLTMFKGRPELAAAAYNAGPRALSGWLGSLSTLPTDLFLASIPYEETRTYVYRVMGNYARYAYLQGRPLPEVPLELPQGLVAPSDAY